MDEAFLGDDTSPGPKSPIRTKKHTRKEVVKKVWRLVLVPDGLLSCSGTAADHITAVLPLNPEDPSDL